VAHSEWERIEPLLARVERPARYIDSEWGVAPPDPDDYRVVLVYPDTYELGMANQALQILYDALNAVDGITAERAFVPWIDMADELRGGGVALASLESARPVSDADLVGITLPYELTATNILEFLDLAGIPVRSEHRDATHPLIVGGGPCAFNPEPLAAFLDAILIGEGEQAVFDIVDVHRRTQAEEIDRPRQLAELASVSGLYVPRVHREGSRAADGTTPSEVASAVASERREPVLRRVVSDLAEHRPPICPIVPYMDVVHDRSMIEVMRGCTRGCRFCQAGMVYRPVRERPADEVVRDALASLACTGHEEVSLTSLSTTDHSQLEEIMRRLSRRLEGTATTVSLPSLRVDGFSVDMARLATAGKKSGLTFAPEAGTQRLRDVINKNVTEEELLQTVEYAFQAGWRRVKLYFMIGLPTETDDDVRGIGALVSRVLETARANTPKDQRGSVRVGVSVSTFVPKAHTPFQWDGQIRAEEVDRRQTVLRETCPRKGVDLSWHDREVSMLEAVLARGGAELADVIEGAWRGGARYDAWTERFKLGTWHEAATEAGLDLQEMAARQFTREDALPWEVVDTGVSEQYLWAERERALTGTTTPDCSFSGCTGCDACDELGVETIVAGERRG
jgi:radical SAM family uncharacterized protein